MNLANTRTLENLMRAFSGESQARNRYYMAASAAKNEQLQCIQRIFEYTANQEFEHAEIFFKRLKTGGVKNIEITAGYPVDLQDDVLYLLKEAHHNEYEEHQIAYPGFARIAQEEGFADIARIFTQIAEIERSHGDRFGTLADRIQAGTLFKGNADSRWLCLNCGYIHTGEEAPKICPVCSHAQGYFLEEKYAPYIIP